MLRYLTVFLLSGWTLTAFAQASQPATDAANATHFAGSEASNFFANLLKAGANPTVSGDTSTIQLDMLQCQVSADGRYCWLMRGGVQENAGALVDQGIYAGLYQEMANYGSERSAGRALETYAYDIDCQQTLSTKVTACTFVIR